MEVASFVNIALILLDNFLGVEDSTLKILKIIVPQFISLSYELNSTKPERTCERLYFKLRY